MGKHCIYCKANIDENSVIDVCQGCGISVWGHKMFAAIVENMQDAREAGNLYQGSVTDSENSDSNQKPKRSGLSSIAREALAVQEYQPLEMQTDLNSSRPTREDIPPLVESFSKPESLGPENEINPIPMQSQSFFQQPSLSQPPQQIQPPQYSPELLPQHVEPQVPSQTEDPVEESASLIIDNLNERF
ncbi:MAG: hypothetical protein KKD18_05965 [Nanoarchaeota archaeon]|nr:hypothetical protein [Nanoarchaeota archaeon]